MANMLTKSSTATAGIIARERDNIAFQSLCGRSWWLSLVFISLGLSIFAGCIGPSQQILTARTLSQMKEPEPNKDLQQQLMMQASKASLVNYKDYQVGPEDQLVIAILGQDNLRRELRVNGQGEITMPLVGAVKVSGLTPQEIEKRLADLYNARFLVNPQVTVEVKEFRHQRVAVTGAVAKPGSYEIIGPRTLLEVLSLAGGFSGAAAGDIVNVIRNQNAPDLAKTIKTAPKKGTPKTEIMVIDLRRLLSGQEPQLNIAVRNGDVIDVPFAGTAYITGAVRKPGNILVKENLTVSQAVAMGGGIDPVLGTNNITIMRLNNQGVPVNIYTNLNNIIARKNPDIPIKNNDLIIVQESSIKTTIYVLRSLLPIPSPTLPAF